MTKQEGIEEAIKRLGEVTEYLLNQHWCGLQGFGCSLTDKCPMCEIERRKEEK